MVCVSVKNRKRFSEGHVCQEVRRVCRKAVEREARRRIETRIENILRKKEGINSFNIVNFQIFSSIVYHQ